jgi:hypothetical protein
MMTASQNWHMGSMEAMEAMELAMSMERAMSFTLDSIECQSENLRFCIMHGYFIFMGIWQYQMPYSVIKYMAPKLRERIPYSGMLGCSATNVL